MLRAESSIELIKGNVCRVAFLRRLIYIYIRNFTAPKMPVFRDENLLLVHGWALNFMEKRFLLRRRKMLSLSCNLYDLRRTTRMEDILIHVFISWEFSIFRSKKFFQRNSCNSASIESLFELVELMEEVLVLMNHKEEKTGAECRETFANITNLAVNYKEFKW